MNESKRYAEEYEVRFTPLRNYPREAAFADRLMRRPDREPPAVLDLACGSGGHALELARLGWRVTGLDVNQPMLERLQAKAADAGVSVATLRADMTAFKVEQSFQAAINLFYSFQDALPDEAAREAFLTCVYHALDPGALFLLDYLPEENNLRLYPLGQELPVSRVQGEDGLVMETTSLSSILSAEEKEIIFCQRTFRHGQLLSEERRRGVLRRLYLEPTRALFRHCGFAVEAEFGDFDAVCPFDENSRRIVTLLRREGDRP